PEADPGRVEGLERPLDRRGIGKAECPRGGDQVENQLQLRTLELGVELRAKRRGRAYAELRVAARVRPAAQNGAGDGVDQLRLRLEEVAPDDEPVLCDPNADVPAAVGDRRA